MSMDISVIREAKLDGGKVCRLAFGRLYDYLAEPRAHTNVDYFCKKGELDRWLARGSSS